jgi:RNA polymerase sigma factor (sigma-70 family)
MTTDLNRALRRLQQALQPGETGLSDGQLLARFVAARDEDAFAALVRRHGRMVLGVCRRLLGGLHDAEDAFQATFLVLARRAAAVVRRESVAAFLHGVACRVAREALAVRARRRARERQVEELPHPAAAPADVQDWRPLLDRELQRLPEKYRLAVVLCELEGRPRKEAARQLGVPEGTLSSRLAAARRLLGERLARRGVILSAALSAILAEAAAAAAVPAALAETAARCSTAATAATLAAASTPAAVLANGVLGAMLMTRLKLTAGLLLAAAALTFAGYRASAGGGNGPPAAPAPEGPPVLAAPQEDGKKKAADAANPPGRADGLFPVTPLEAGEVVRLLRAIYQGQKDAPAFIADPKANAVLVRGSPDQVAQVKTLIDELKAAGPPRPRPQPDAGNPRISVFRVAPLDAAEVAKALQEMFGSPKVGGPHITADPVTNAVFISGTPEQLASAEAVINALLQPGPPGAKPPHAGAVDPRGDPAARLQEARDEVELLEAQLAVKKAHLEAARAAYDAAQANWKRLKINEGAVPQLEIEHARAEMAAAERQLRIHEAELLEPEVRLKQARRRLEGLQRPAEGQRQQLEQRLLDLEGKLDALRKEVEALRRELKPGKP